MLKKNDPEFRARAARLVGEHRAEYPTEAACENMPIMCIGLALLPQPHTPASTAAGDAEPR